MTVAGSPVHKALTWFSRMRSFGIGQADAVGGNDAWDDDSGFLVFPASGDKLRWFVRRDSVRLVHLRP